MRILINVELTGYTLGHLGRWPRGDWAVTTPLLAAVQRELGA